MLEGVAIHRLIFDENNNPINYMILDVNESFENILGLKKENVINKLASEVYGNVPLLKEYSDVVINKKSNIFEYFFQDIKKYFTISVTHWEDDGFITIFSDVTDRKEIIENYKTLLRAIPDMMARVGNDGHIIDIKPGEGTFSELGQSTHYVGNNISDLPFGEVIAGEFKKIIDEVIEKNEPIEFCYSIKIKNEDRHYYSRTVKNSDQDVIVIVRDITEETKISEDLRNSKDFAENLMRTANVMVVGLDINGNVKLFNMAAEKLTGYSREEIIGKNWFKEIPILPKNIVSDVNTIFTNLIHDDESYNVAENPIITKHGEIKYIMWQNNEIRENGIVTGTISFGLDMTERKKYEEEIIKARDKAEQSDKMKLEFLANMSHDLRTPMNAIIGFSDLLRANNLNKNERSDYINTIIINGKFLMALIDDIIDISKIDANNLKIEKNDFELNKLIDEIRLTHLKQVKDKNIDIIIDIDINKNIIVHTDKYRLRQIMTNLIGNAIKFTKEGYVKFGYKIINKEQLVIYVEDTGCGIEKSNQKIIFERFKQIQDQNGNKFRGAGLGLSISKSLIELLGFKDIKLDSEIGRGSKFYFYVPYTIKHYNYINELKMKKNKKMNFVGKTILMVEDDNDSRTIMKSFLCQTNANIIECVDGYNVIEKIQKEDIDLVIMDIGLPGKNGYVLIKEIREIDDRLPILVESALAMPDEKNKAYQSGCDDFISKPFSKEEFLNKIDNLL